MILWRWQGCSSESSETTSQRSLNLLGNTGGPLFSKVVDQATHFMLACYGQQRAHLQVAIWLQALDPNPAVLDPTSYGWSQEEGSTALSPTTGVKEREVGETGGKATGVKEREVGETRAKEWEVGETGAKETGGKGSGQNVMERIERKSYSAAVIEGVRKRARVFVGDSIVRKTDRVLNKGDDVVVCLPGAKIEAITQRVKNIVGSGKGGSVLVHVGTNNVEREGTTAIVRKYRQLVRTLKQTRVEQVILSGILPVMGRRGHKYRNCRGMAINMLVQKLCMEEEVGFVDLWGSFVGRADMYMKDGLHLSGKGAAVFADKLSAAVDSDLGTMTNIFGSKHSLN